MKHTSRAIVVFGAVLVAIIAASLCALHYNENSTKNITQATGDAVTKRDLLMTGGVFTGPHTIDLTSSDNPNGDITAQAHIDARGNVQTTIIENGSENMFIHVDGVTFLRFPTDNSWIRFNGSSTETGTQFTADDVSIGYSETDLQSLSNIQQGKDTACELGSCRTYTAKNDRTNEEVYIQMDIDSNRISTIDLKAENGKSTSIFYTYDTVVPTVTVPVNYTEI